jgi:putative transposase
VIRCDVPPETWSIPEVRIPVLGLTQREDGCEEVRCTEEQIIQALRQAEAGTPAVEVCRKLGVSEQTFYRWKRQFAGMGVVELRRLRQVEEENRKLKQLVADLSLDKHMLQEALQKNW